MAMEDWVDRKAFQRNDIYAQTWMTRCRQDKHFSRDSRAGKVWPVRWHTCPSLQVAFLQMARHKTNSTPPGLPRGKIGCRWNLSWEAEVLPPILSSLPILYWFLILYSQITYHRLSISTTLNVSYTTIQYFSNHSTENPTAGRHEPMHMGPCMCLCCVLQGKYEKYKL